MSAEKKKQGGVLGLIVALIVVLLGGVLFMGATSGWFDNPKVVLDSEYYGGNAEFIDLSANEYEGLIDAKKTFAIFVDQSGCTTADKLRGFVQDYMKETGTVFYKMMFEQDKESSLHEYVKYYPSVVVVNKGKVAGYLRADSDEDAAAYNNYDDFKVWISKYL